MHKTLFEDEAEFDSMLYALTCGSDHSEEVQSSPMVSYNLTDYDMVSPKVLENHPYVDTIGKGRHVFACNYSFSVFTLFCEAKGIALKSRRDAVLISGSTPRYYKQTSNEGFSKVHNFSEGAFDFDYMGNSYSVIVIADMFCSDSKTFLFGDDIDSLRSLHDEVGSHFNRTHLTFDGAWRMSPPRTSDFNWDNLSLKEEDKANLRADLDRFFSDESTEFYKKMGIPKKRGILLVGPPGTGKSTAGKIIASIYSQSFIHIVSLDNENYNSKSGVETVFKRAREISPCILFFEDLDSQLNEFTRSVFLNALDGLDSGDGILTIATTNHPEKIDPALLQRPSRFDRVYVFPLPSSDLRESYLRTRLANLTNAKDWLEADISEVVKKTDNFSYAQLQELLLSSWNKFGSNEDPLQVLAREADYLHETTKPGFADALARKFGEKNQSVGFRRNA